MRSNKRRTLLVFSALLPVLIAQGQSGPAEEWLSGAWADIRYEQYSTIDAFFNKSTLEIPRLEELEFRTETRENDPRQQEYTLRFAGNNERMRQAQRQINSIEQELRYQEAQTVLEELLYERYQHLINTYLIQAEATLLADEGVWLADRQRWVSQQIATKGEVALAERLKLKKEELTYSATQRGLMQAQAILPPELSDTPVGMADLETLKQRLAQLDQQTKPALAEDQKRALEVDLATAEQRLEVAEDRRILDFLQVRYRGNENRTIADRWSVGAAFQLPVPNANRVKLQYLELEKMEEAQSWQNWKASHQEEIAEVANELQEALSEYEALQAEQLDYLASFSAKALLEQGIIDAEVLLEARGLEFDLARGLLEQEARLYGGFLDYLLLSGQLIAPPYRNWLSSNSEMPILR